MARRPGTINIRNLSVKCGRCGQYQVLAAFERAAEEEWNVYIYECDWPPCDEDREGSRTLVEVPVDLDEFANRDPNWGGGKKHAGADLRAGEEDGASPGDADTERAEDEDGGGRKPSGGLVVLGS